jgi:hypothetical protein
MIDRAAFTVSMLLVDGDEQPAATNPAASTKVLSARRVARPTTRRCWRQFCIGAVTFASPFGSDLTKPHFSRDRAWQASLNSINIDRAYSQRLTYVANHHLRTIRRVDNVPYVAGSRTAATHASFWHASGCLKHAIAYRFETTCSRPDAGSERRHREQDRRAHWPPRLPVSPACR